VGCGVFIRMESRFVFYQLITMYGSLYILLCVCRYMKRKCVYYLPMYIDIYIS
jgi:hypothetical protein